MIEDVSMKISLIWQLFNRFIDRFWRSMNQRLAIGGCCLLAIGLSGCVKYETGVKFVGLNYGEIVEHIQLGEQLTSFSQTPVQTWLASIEQRAKQAQGRVEHLSERELKVIIPFDNARDLVTKIDRYFNPGFQPTNPSSKLKSHLRIDQNNFFLLVRNHLAYDIDLSSLMVKTSDPKVAVSSVDFVDLNFSLQSPWPIQLSDRANNLPGIASDGNRQVNWQLQPGKINHLDAIFWLPSYLGVGTLLITLISIAGYYVKYRQLPWINLK
jgi:Protein of unknown function (DUF3153)